ncbi:DUF3570 domain-containing protein [Wenyingzhuangia sp. IMCC45574]
MKLITQLLFLMFVSVQAQKTQKSAPDKENDPPKTYQKRVLEATEVDFLTSYYQQDGNNAAVTGGIGSEKLTDFTPTVVISVPLNANDVLTIDAGISTYTSASSSNLDPFDSSGASANGEGEDDDDDDDDDHGGSAAGVTGNPWVASSGASNMDTWGSIAASYSHSSDDRNTIWNANVSFAAEYDYMSIGFGGGLTKLFNDKNTELGISAKVFLDNWMPKYPTELDSYIEAGRDVNNGFFQGVDILNENGVVDRTWKPIDSFNLIQDTGRNTYTFSFSFSQILSKNVQISIFSDAILQSGWLANPMQRVYFKDRPNYYIGNAANISNYTSPVNTDVFHLADDLERLPDSRFKLPMGARFHYYLNENLTLRTYYRYYWDNWGVTAHTAEVELPIKVGEQFTLYPSYRYYKQTAMDYFAPYEEHVSTSQYYTSDYDLSAFSANQVGLGIKYTDIFTKYKMGRVGLKNVNLKYSNYTRSNGLKAGIVSFGMKFIIE